MTFTSAKYMPMTMDQVQVVAPSVFATEPWDGVSDRYSFIPTFRVLEVLLSEGWQIMKATQNRVRLPGQREFAKHMIRLRRPGTDLVVGDTFPEGVLTNDHRGKGAYVLDGGVFRLLCLNGMVCDEGTFSSQHIRHKGHVIDDVRIGLDNFVKTLPLIGESIEKMREIELTPDERQVFGYAAMNLRFDEEQMQHIEVHRAVQPRRHQDANNDLWSTFNVIQENMTKGGLKYWTPTTRDEEGYHPSRRHTTKEIKSITEDVRLNKALWTLAEELKRLKSAG